MKTRSGENVPLGDVLDEAQLMGTYQKRPPDAA